MAEYSDDRLSRFLNLLVLKLADDPISPKESYVGPWIGYKGKRYSGLIVTAFDQNGDPHKFFEPYNLRYDSEGNLIVHTLEELMPVFTPTAVEIGSLGKPNLSAPWKPLE